MNIAATFSLVSGEEEISPLFMDGTGHGTSVAGLAATKNNGEANEYGAGLIDISYALEHYDSFKEQYKEKKNPDADDVSIYKERWTCASKAVTSALKAYNTSNGEGNSSHFESVLGQNQYKLINIYPYMVSAVGTQTAEAFSSHSITYK